jgi:hypothetical protein
MTATPCSRSHSIPPWKVSDSPTTTVPIWNWRTRPLQYQQAAGGEGGPRSRAWIYDSASPKSLFR